MSRLEELIQKLCPNGVEYKKIGQIGNVRMCKRILKSQTNTFGDVPFYKIGTFGKKADSYISLQLFNEYKNKYSYPKIGDVLISCSGTIGRTVIFDGKPSYFQDSNIVWLEHDNKTIINKYLLYCYELKPWNLTTGGTISRLYNENILKAKIPVPPMEVQEEIVRILDNFTELTAELTNRRKQYEYYRDELLSFKGQNIEFKPLGEIATIVRGGNFQKKDFCSDGVPCIHYGQIYTVYGLEVKKAISCINETIAKNCKFANYGDIIMAVTSENVEDVCKCIAWFGNEKAAISGHTAIIKHNQNAKYLTYYFHTQMFFYQKKKLAHGTKVIEITPSKLENIMIPIPPLAEQERIVSILDRFDKLCNDITEGLPAEIELRKKQYEYYRDKLLTFKELS